MPALHIDTKTLAFKGVHQLSVNARSLHAALGERANPSFDKWWAFAWGFNGLEQEDFVVDYATATPWLALSAAREILGGHCTGDEPALTDRIRDFLRGKEREWLLAYGMEFASHFMAEACREMNKAEQESGQ